MGADLIGYFAKGPRQLTPQAFPAAFADKVIVFAGERSWGDSPSGAGLQLLGQAGSLGVAAALGVWVECACSAPKISELQQGDRK